MSLLSQARQAITGVLSGISEPKVLIVDDETMKIISVLLSQSDILDQKVLLVQLLKNEDQTESFKHLACVMFVRPTVDNTVRLCREMRAPRFMAYHICFSNALKSDYLEKLARHDTLHLIQQITEIFLDVHLSTSNLFHLSLPGTLSLFNGSSTWSAFDRMLFDRQVEGIFSVLVLLGICPTIRYTSTSELCRSVANQLNWKLNNDISLFKTKAQKEATLLLMDRRRDPVTPLLNQWSYYAMVHELLGIENNCITLGGEKFDFPVHGDTFLDANLFTGFGELGQLTTDYVKDYERKSKEKAQIDTLEDMQKFVESFPEFQQMSSSVTKHVKTLHELSNLVTKTNLIEVSQLEQDIFCDDVTLENVVSAIGDPKNPGMEKLRLGLLYVLRNESDSKGRRDIRDALLSEGIDPPQVHLLEDLITFGGRVVRGAVEDPLGFDASVFAAAKKVVQRNLAGSGNVFERHKSLLHSEIDSLLRGKLKDSRFDTISSALPGTTRTGSTVVIFVLGGVTLEEYKDVMDISKSYPNVKVIIGGSTVLNSKLYLADLSRAMSQDIEAETIRTVGVFSGR